MKSLEQGVKYYTQCRGCPYKDTRILTIDESIMILTGETIKTIAKL